MIHLLSIAGLILVAYVVVMLGAVWLHWWRGR